MQVWSLDHRGRDGGQRSDGPGVSVLGPLFGRRVIWEILMSASLPFLIYTSMGSTWPRAGHITC